MKTCNRCELNLHTSFFYVSKVAKDGFRGMCKSCTSIDNKYKSGGVSISIADKREIHKMFYKQKIGMLKIAKKFRTTVANIDGIISVPMDGLTYKERLAKNKKAKPLKRGFNGELL